MKGQLVKQLKEQYGIRRILGKKVEHYNFYTLCFYLEMAERGEVIK
jgi:hypothetical protein